MRDLFRLLISFILLVPLQLHAQQIPVKGRILDSVKHTPIRYASVTFDTVHYEITSENGDFSFMTTPGVHVLQISCIGYRNHIQYFEVFAGKPFEIDIPLSGHESQLNQVVVSSSRQQKQLAREVVSMTVLQPYLISSTNSRDLSEVLNRVPGVSIIDGQPTMRAGVGYSYNVGSRVTVLLDDMPLMGPDVGDVHWKFLPIEAAEQIEVTQGASSSLYGSSAMNGTINVRSGWPGAKPETKLTLYQGIYDNPDRKHTIWWERTSQPSFNGMSFVHRRAFGQWDVVWSGNYLGEHSYIKTNDEFRGRTYLKTRYRFKSIPGLSAGINGNLMIQKAGRFFLWGSADTFSLQPFQGSTGQDFYSIYSVDPHVTWEINKTFSMALKIRYYKITRYVDDIAFPGQNDAIADIVAGDYNVQKSFFRYVHLTSGLYATTMSAVGNVYPGRYTGYSAAGYAQLTFERKRWTAVAGFRYEMNALGAIQSTASPLKRFGLNFQAASQTFLRWAYGEGYRFPTVAERYVNDKVGKPPVQLVIAPNPDLKTETGWTSELGIKQGFHIGDFTGYGDICAFISEYVNLIDFRFQQLVYPSYNRQTGEIVQGVIGFKANNYGNTRTAGFEIALSGEGKMAKDLLVRTLSGITYAYPVSMDTLNKYSMSFMDGFTKSFTRIDSAERNSILPFRNRILVKADIELNYRRFSIGYGSFYYSKYDKIDEFIYFLFADLRDFMDRTGAGDWVHNVRMGYRLTPACKVSFLVNNIGNREYAIRPMKIDPPRNYTLQVTYFF